MYWKVALQGVCLLLLGTYFDMEAGDQGGEVWETTAKDELALRQWSRGPAWLAFWVRQEREQGRGPAREEKGSDLHHDGVLEQMGPLGDMCRSWVGWAAVAGVGLDPSAGDDVSGRW